MSMQVFSFYSSLIGGGGGDHDDDDNGDDNDALDISLNSICTILLPTPCQWTQE